MYENGNSRPVRHDLHVAVGISDRDVVRQLKGFDGLEVVSVRHTGRGEWQDSALRFNRSLYVSGNTHDNHVAVIEDVNVDSVLRHGVAVALSTNVGSAALQPWGANFPVSYRNLF